MAYLKFITRPAVIYLLLVVSPFLYCKEYVASLDYEIVHVFPHDRTSYTQGLLFHKGYFYESSGLYGKSFLRKLEPETGKVLREIKLDSDKFAEGLARVGNKLIQLTWKSGQAFVYDLDTFKLLRTYTYKGEGWGLCYDGSSLYMSDGSSAIKLRDPETFVVTGEINVHYKSYTVRQINELECVGDHIYANVYTRNMILKINKYSGEVVAQLNGDSIELRGERPQSRNAVLNGIAYDEDSGHFFVTGKFWPKLMMIKFK